MNWQDHKTRIRRYLRDPDGNIWADGLLWLLWNDAQREVQHKTGVLEDAAVVRVPPHFQMSYTFDWEWAHTGHARGEVYQAFRYHHQGGWVCSQLWEMQAVWGVAAAEATSPGNAFSFPWEAWYCDTPGDFPPLRFPKNFHQALMAAWDEEPIEYIDRKQLSSEDPTWLTRAGKPYGYWRPDETDDFFYLYPRPSAPVWDDEESAETGRAHRGQVLHDDQGDTYSSELGVIADWPGYADNQDPGIALEVLDAADNVFMAYKAMPEDFTGRLDDESDLPPYLTKYVEHGVLERAYGANTDGRIESLRDYWAMRKEMGLRIIKRFLLNRLVDRDYRLVTPGVPGRRTRRQPKLPDEYPAAW